MKRFAILLITVFFATSAFAGFQNKRDSAANWTSIDPTLGAGEIGVEEGTNQMKVGNGSGAWTTLPYVSQSPAIFKTYTAAQTLTAAVHNTALVQMTTADEVTMWDCETANVGQYVMLWARDAEKIEVVPASGDAIALFNGTALTAGNELDIAATAGTKVTLMCTADDTWSVINETAASTDGGAAD